MEIKPIKKKTISDQVFSQMKEMVLKGIWKPGEKLPSENVLAESFEVSRITVRQALQKMSMIGLVETRFGDGSYIKRPNLKTQVNRIYPIAYLDDKDMHDVLEFRQVIEVETAAVAAEKATADDVKTLQSLFDEMKQLAAEKRWKDFAENDLNFHYTIAKTTKNELIIGTNDILRDILKNAMIQIVDKLGCKIGIYYHGRLLECIKNHDPYMARKMMYEHLLVTKNTMYPKNKKDDILEGGTQNGRFGNSQKD